MRYTFPALITNSLMLCRRYKRRSSQENQWLDKASSIIKFSRQLIYILATQVEAPTIALPLFLLAAQIADGCGLEDITYDLYVQAFTVFEDCISESRAQLQAITQVIGSLQLSKVFSVDNYDTLITKAALHGAKLLKKPHQAIAVHLASHLWWQNSVAEEFTSQITESGSSDRQKIYPHRDSQRVLECLQKSLRIANSATEAIVTVQLYCDALSQYIYYLEHNAAAVTTKFVNSLVELITNNIQDISLPDVHPAQRAPPGLLEGVHNPEMITRHFSNVLYVIRSRKAAPTVKDSKWEAVDVSHALMKLGVGTTSESLEL